MTAQPPAGERNPRGAPSASRPGELIRSEEQLSVHIERFTLGRARFRRIIVTETRHIPVVVRREKLVIEKLPPDADAAEAASAPPEPFVIMLREEVPTVELRTHAYEKVTVSIAHVTNDETVSAQLRKEAINVEEH